MLNCVSNTYLQIWWRSSITN